MATVLPPKGDLADPPQWHHDTVHVNGVVLHYVETGNDPADPEQPLVVLLHGFPGFWYDWHHQLDPLADAGYHVVAPDLRGYNRSEKPEGVSAYRMAELVADVAELVEAFDRDSAVLVGHDWGGGVAWETAIRRPEVVERLAVCNAPHPQALGRAWLRTPAQLRRSWYMAAFQLPRLPERILAADDYRRILAALESGTTTDALDDADRRRYHNAIARRGALTAALNYYRAAARSAPHNWLGRALPGAGRDESVPVPTLVCWGDADDALVPDLAEASQRFAPASRAVHFPDAGHWVQLDDPDGVTAALLAFFGEDDGTLSPGTDRDAAAPAEGGESPVEKSGR
ncbi:alpha/beta fold hydrolase [Halobacteriales archaeon Cl-PHB]